MITMVRTDSDHPDFTGLVRHLDAELAERDGSENAFYAQFNSIANLTHVMIAFDDDLPVGCGALKPYSSDTVELKRMFTSPEHRGKGIASRILSGLEEWAKELSYQRCILETGKRQPEAIGLYKKHGFRNMPNYGQYEGMENSVCFEKEIG